MSGFSEEVAIAVTQPLWPSMEPRKRSDSDMVLFVICVDGLERCTATVSQSQAATVTLTVQYPRS